MSACRQCRSTGGLRSPWTAQAGRHELIGRAVQNMSRIAGRQPAAARVGGDHFRRCFEASLIGMAVTSPSKGILEVNQELCRILGYDRSELLQAKWSHLTYPADLAADLAQFDRMLAGEIDGYALDSISRRIHPAILDDLGLLLSGASASRSRSSTGCRSRSSGRPGPRDSGGRGLVPVSRRQESLRNIGSSAGAPGLRAVEGPGATSCCRSTTPARHRFGPPQRPGRGLGLVSMEERLRIVGGTLCIRSHQSRGRASRPRCRSRRDAHHSAVRRRSRDCYRRFAACPRAGFHGGWRGSRRSGALVDATTRLKPEVVVADVSMPILNGIEATRQIRQTTFGVKIVFFTMHSDVVYAAEAFRAGRSRYVLRRAPPAARSSRVREVLAGRTYVTSAVDRRL